MLPGQGGTVQFKYDPFGRRIEKIAPSGTTIFAYDGDNVVETTNQNGGILSRFAQGQNIDEPLAESNSSGIDYYEADGLGSITSLTNGVGTVAQTYTYDSFGNTTHSTGSLANPFQYTAREFDSETGLYYYRARYYDPSVSRFLSEDPFRFRGAVDFYEYALNSPLDYVDPSGLKSWYRWGIWNWVPGVAITKCAIWSHYCVKEAAEREQQFFPYQYQFSNEDLSNFQGDAGKRMIRICTQGDDNCKNLDAECGGPILGLIFKTGAFPSAE